MKIKDKTFEPYIEEARIVARVKELAQQIELDFESQNPLLIGILNGSFIFAADLVRNISVPCEISFVKVSSYQATKSTGNIKEEIGLQVPIFKRHIIIVEDIVDTGQTLADLTERFKALGPASISIATLLHKPDATVKEIELKYVGFPIDNKFVIGYGLDYDGYGRNTRDIYQLKS